MQIKFDRIRALGIHMYFFLFNINYHFFLVLLSENLKSKISSCWIFWKYLLTYFVLFWYRIFKKIVYILIFRVVLRASCDYKNIWCIIFQNIFPSIQYLNGTKISTICSFRRLYGYEFPKATSPKFRSIASAVSSGIWRIRQPMN